MTATSLLPAAAIEAGGDTLFKAASEVMQQAGMMPDWLDGPPGAAHTPGLQELLASAGPWSAASAGDASLPAWEDCRFQGSELERNFVAALGLNPNDVEDAQPTAARRLRVAAARLLASPRARPRRREPLGRSRPQP